jgi:hypothetical protein
MRKSFDAKGWFAGCLAAGMAGLQAQSYPPTVNHEVAADTYRADYYGTVSYGGKGSVAVGDQTLGDLSLIYARAGVLANFQTSDRYAWRVGLDWQRFSFGTPDPSLMPNTLVGTSLKLGSQWSFAPDWSLRVDLSPGLYSDFSDVSWDDVNVPVAVSVAYDVNRALQLMAAVSFDPRGEYPVLGGVGLRWHFSEDGTLYLTAPRPRIEYSFSTHWAAFVGADFVGGTFRVAEDFGRRHGRAELDNTWLSYREFRVGGGLRWLFSPALNLTIEGGWVVDRRFKYFDQRLMLNGDGAPYVQAVIGGSY